MQFRGKYEFKKVEVVSDEIVRLSPLSPKEAADPSILSGALIKLSNELDVLLVVGDDVYKVGTITPARLLGGGRWVSKLPEKEANLLLEWLRVEEK